jgi:hypothetical protein
MIDDRTPIDPSESSYGWIIDKDYIPFTSSDNRVFSGKGAIGPRNIPDSLLTRLEATPRQGRKFKIYDDDGELYYDGRIVFSDESLELESEHGLPDEAFAPLDDYGAPNDGATSIKYKFDGEWVVTMVNNDSPFKIYEATYEAEYCQSEEE